MNPQTLATHHQKRKEEKENQEAPTRTLHAIKVSIYAQVLSEII